MVNAISGSMGCRSERKPFSVHTCKVQVLALAIALGSGIEMNPLVKYKVSKAAESDRGIIHPCRQKNGRQAHKPQTCEKVDRHRSGLVAEMGIAFTSRESAWLQT